MKDSQDKVISFLEKNINLFTQNACYQIMSIASIQYNKLEEKRLADVHNITEGAFA